MLLEKIVFDIYKHALATKEKDKKNSLYHAVASIIVK